MGVGIPLAIAQERVRLRCPDAAGGRALTQRPGRLGYLSIGVTESSSDQNTMPVR
jgi:hypothetical protein